MKTLIKLLVPILYLTAVNTILLRADEPGEKSNPIPFHGKIASVDRDQRTITLQGKQTSRTIVITSTTKIHKNQAPASLDDAQVGDEVGGQLRKTGQGTLEALSLRIGPKPDGKGKKREKQSS